MPSSKKPLTTVQSSAGKLHADIATASSQLFPEGAGQESLLAFLNAAIQQELAVIRLTPPVVDTGQASYDIRLSGENDPIWVSDNPGTNLVDLFMVIFDDEVVPVKDVGSAVVTVASLTGASVGDGFTLADPLTLNFSTPLPNSGLTFSIYYAARQQVATFTPDALSFPNMRQAMNPHPETLQLLEDLHAVAVQAWDGPWDATIEALAASGLNERYRRQTTVPGSFNFDTPGDGNLITRDGLAPSVQAGQLVTEDFTNGFIEPTMAHWLSEIEGDDTFGGNPTAGVSGGSGFFSLAAVKHTDSLDELSKRAYSAGSHVTAALRNLVASTINTANTRTRVAKAITCTLNPTAGGTSDARREIDVTGTNFFQNGASNTEIAVGIDMVKIVFTGPLASRTPEIYVVTDILSTTRIRVRSMTGGRPEFTSGASITDCTLQVIKMVYHEGGGAAGFNASDGSHPDPVELDTAIYHAVLPAITDDPATAVEYLPKPARYLAAARTAFEYSHIGDAVPNALAWGGFDPTLTTPQVFPGALRGDGGVKATIVEQGVRAVTISGAGTTTWHPGLEGAILVVAFTHAAGVIAWTLDLHADYDPVDGEKLEVFLFAPVNSPPGGTAEVDITWPSAAPRAFIFDAASKSEALFINEGLWLEATHMTDGGSFFACNLKNYKNQVVTARSFRTESHNIILNSAGGGFVWRPMQSGGYVEIDIQDVGAYTMTLTAEGTDFPLPGTVLYIEVLQTGVAGGTITWPGNFTFSGGDAVIPPAIGDRVLYRALYTISSDWLLTRTDY